MSGRISDRSLGLRMLTLLGALVIEYPGIPGNVAMAAQDSVWAPSTPVDQEDLIGLPLDVFDELYRTCIFDCNGNGIEDAWEYVYGGKLDSDNNGLLDECEFRVVGVGGAPAHGIAAGVQPPLAVYRDGGASYSIGLRVSLSDSLHDARIDIIDPSGRLRSTILSKAIRIDTTVAWRAPKRWPDGLLFQRGFYDIVGTVGKNTYRATVFLDSDR